MRCVHVLNSYMFSLLVLTFLAPAALAATLTVTNTNDSGAGSLRQAIADTANGDTIVFNLTYPATITLTSALTPTSGRTLTIAGPGRTNLTISGNNTNRIFYLVNVNLTLSGLLLTNANLTGTNGYGGAIYHNTGTLSLSECELAYNQNNCTSTNGGAAIYCTQGTVNLDRCYVHHNTCPTSVASNGGALLGFYGTYVISHSTISNNVSYSGAAILASNGTVTMTNVTASGNTSTMNGALNLTTGTLTNCTAIDNHSSLNDAGLYGRSGGSITLTNSILAKNTSSSPSGNSDMNCTATFISGGYNFIGSAGALTYTWGTGDQHGTESAKLDPNIVFQANNGGWVQTNALNSGSGCINPASSNGAPFVDGRGYLRSGTADRGAYEYGGTLPSASSASGLGIAGFTANWSAATGAAGYLIDVATNSGFTTFVSGYQNYDAGNTTSLAISGLTSGTTYYYRIRAYNGTLRSYHSNTVTVTTLLPTATRTITRTATPTPSSTATRTATPTPTITRTSTETPTATITPTLTASATVTLTGTETATPTITPTLTASATATETPTASPTPSNSATSTVTPTLTASASMTPTGTETPTPTITVTSTESPTATVSPTLTASVTASQTATISPTATVSATSTETEVAVVLSGDNTLRAFPNPASNRVHFSLSLKEAGDVRIALFNLAGERVAELSGNQPAGISMLTWACDHAAPGIYLVRIKAGSVEKTFKLAIVR